MLWTNSSGVTDWRLYQDKNGDVTFTAAQGYVIKSVTLIFTNSDKGILQDGDNTIESGTAYELNNVSSKTFVVGNSGTKTNGKIKITSFSVNYDVAA